MTCIKEREFQHYSRFEFNVENFSNFSEEIASNEFSSFTGCNSKWKVFIKPLADDSDSEQKRISIGLQKLDSKKHTVRMSVICFLKNSSGNYITVNSMSDFVEHDFENDNILLGNFSKTSNKYRLKPEKYRLTTENGATLTLCQDDMLHIQITFNTLLICKCKENQLNSEKNGYEQPFAETLSKNEFYDEKFNIVQSNADSVVKLKCDLHTNPTYSENINTVQPLAEKFPSVEGFANKISVVQGYADSVIQLQRDLSVTFDKQQFTDIVFKFNDGSISAHKYILCARSPFFKNMFECDLQEKATNMIEILDYSIESISTFLKFLYSGVLEIHGFDTIVSMYSLADKYDVASLQETCRKILLEDINESNVISILNLGELHSDDIMKEMAIDFVCENFKEVEPTEEWQNLAEHHPRLALKIALRLAKR